MSLLEREDELKELRSAFAGALEGRGRLTVVEGVAGSGKSSLLAETSERARAAGLKVLDARGGELEREFAFGTIRHLFETVVAGADPAERERLLAGAAAPAAAVLARGADPKGGRPSVEPGFGVLHAVYWLATNLSLGAPLLIAVDDLHWVDRSSVRSLSYLARRIGDLPIALVVAMRPDEPGAPVELLDELRAQPGAGRTVLAPLQPGSVASIVRAAIPGADDTLCSACFDASAGNPFYLRELLQTIAQDRAGPVTAEAVRDASVTAVGDRVVRRIGRLGTEAPALARAMAVLGGGARLADAAFLAGVDEAAAADAASRMKRIEILAREDPFEFVHPLVRRSVYDALTVTERDDAHAAAARLLRDAGAPAELVAAHLAALRPAGSTEVVTALREAANDAVARGAPDAAIAALRRALEEEAPEPDRAILLHELGHVEVVGRDAAAVEHLNEALDLARDPVLRARIAVDLVVILAAAGQWDAAVALGADAISQLGDRDPELALEHEALRAMMMVNDPALVEGFDRERDRFRALARGDGWAARSLSALLGCTAALRGDPAEEALELVEHGLRDWRLLEERGAGGWAAAQSLSALVCVEATDRALEVIEEVARRARRDGSLIGAITAVGYRGWVYARRGELARAEAEIRPVMDIAMQNQMFLDMASGFYFLLDAMLERSALDDLAGIAESLEPDPAVLSTTMGAMFLEVRGRLRLARGDRDDALADLRACAATNAALQWGPTWSPSPSVLALALPAGEREEALALAEEEVALTSATSLVRPQGVALRAAGMLAGGEQGIARLEESVAILEHSPARLEHARSLIELGAALRRRGQRVQAREALADGMELAHQCGADRLVARADQELRAAGARPRRVARTGIGALTPSEQRVARLVAEGRTNAEVAQELFVSLKTVETHLSNVYSKLGLSGPGARRGLTGALQRLSGPADFTKVSTTRS